MTPKVFVSSTIKDLESIRESVRNLIIALGYTPIMSEYNDFGSTPTESATRTCYQAVKKCDMGIVIIAKRYGTKDAVTGTSITHGEYREMSKSGIPYFVFVESEVLSYQKVYQENQAEGSPKISYPDVDQPDDLFGFIREVSNNETGIFRIEFDGQNSLCEAIKGQIARHFAYVLRNRTDPVSTNLDKLMNEVIALRRATDDRENREDNHTFLKTSNILRSDNANHYRKFLEVIIGGFEEGVSAVIQHMTFGELLADLDSETVRIADAKDSDVQRTLQNLSPYYFWSLSPTTIAGFGKSKDGKILITETAWSNFSSIHSTAKAEAR
jgi:hypothetical protein